ncbi:MAG: hypothetical protein HKP16_09955 [Xanthomonadales bacterium]|nr:hypothetical protein [Xanthomonadales bacterium]
MIRSLPRLVLLTLIVWAAPVAAQYERPPEENLFRSEERRYRHLEYFGFYASAMAHWNFTRELAPFTNLTWIHVGSASAPEAAIEALVDRVAEARDADVMAVLSIEPFLFENAAGDPRASEEIEGFLVEIRARLEFEGLVDSVAMIYPKDEPFREFVRHRDPDLIEQYITGEVYEEIHADLVWVIEQIKLVFPGKPVGVILSGYELHHRFFSIPENYDWVGFDCYANLFDSCDDRSFVEHYRHLLDHMQPHQRLMAVPETWAWDANLNRADWPEILLQRFRQHLEIALNEPRFIAFVPFIWSIDRGQPSSELGLETFPGHYDDGVFNAGTAFRDFVLRTGMGIKSGLPEFPNMAWAETEDISARPPNRIRGEIMSITRDGLLSAWAFNDALPHKNLRVQVRVRDPRGKIIHWGRLERTFIHDPELNRSDRIGRGFIGLHGYRYAIPPKVLGPHREQNLTIELLSYPDGSLAAPAHIYSLDFKPGRTTYSPLNIAFPADDRAPAERNERSLPPMSAQGRAGSG